MKEHLIDWLNQQEFKVEDLGAHSLVSDDDYPDYAIQVAKRVVLEEDSIGVLLCRSGGGMAIAANKVKGVRAVEIHDKKSAVHAKEDNNANVISLSADWLDVDQAKEAITSFLEAKYSGEAHHQRRISKISEFENS